MTSLSSSDVEKIEGKNRHRDKFITLPAGRLKPYFQLPVEQIILNEPEREHLIEIPPDMADQVDGIPQINPPE